MRDMGTLIIESIVMNYGNQEVLVRLSDPLWFQSFGAVMGMDWHSSGITTSVMYALKRGLNPRARELGLVVCGGRGKYSRETPDQLQWLADHSGLPGDSLIRSSKLVAKVDNNALQDGYQLYQHNFIVNTNGDWAVVQQGMNGAEKTARRYHWCSLNLDGSEAEPFVNAPHTGIVGENHGRILNLTDVGAKDTRSTILSMTHEEPERILREAKLITPKDIQQLELFDNASGGGFDRLSHPGNSLSNPEFSHSLSKGPGLVKIEKGAADSQKYELSSTFAGELAGNYHELVMPAHHEVLSEDVNVKRLGAVLATAYENQADSFENLMLTPGLGPRTLQSLALVSEVIYGKPSRFTDPARFSFAHGGKDGHPFPVPLKVFDESIRVLQDSIEKSKLGYTDKSNAIRRLHESTMQIEKHCSPQADFDALIEYEKSHSEEWDGRTC